MLWKLVVTSWDGVHGKEGGVRMRKPRAATAVVAAAMVGALGFSAPAFAAAGYGAVNVTKDDQAQTVTIGNDAITRTFSFKDKKLKPGKIENKLDKNGGGSLLPKGLRSS